MERGLRRVGMKKVLVLYYSQSGQLSEIVRSFVGPLDKSDGIEVVWEELQPVVPYPFPWPFFRFLGVFPECVCMYPPEMNSLSLDTAEKFDLAILAYQPWYFSPSLPVAGFLKSHDSAVLKNLRVITVIGCKDTWLMAQGKVRECLKRIGARLIDNVVFTDSSPRIVSLITTPLWLWTGKKQGLLGALPPAGVSREDIIGAERFGKAVADALNSGEIEKGNSVLTGLGAVKVTFDDIQFEKIIHGYFLRWGKIIRWFSGREKMRRLPFVGLFVLCLLCMILILFPVAGFMKCFVNPMRKNFISREIDYFESPSGSSTARLESEILQ